MVPFVVSLLLGGLAFLIVERVLSGFRIKGGFGSAVLVAFVYGVVKALLFTFLFVLSLPLVLLTFGLFVLVINALLLWITDKLMHRFEVDSFGTLIWGGILLSILDFAFGLLLRRGAFF